MATNPWLLFWNPLSFSSFISKPWLSPEPMISIYRPPRKFLSPFAAKCDHMLKVWPWDISGSVVWEF
jgi:hypothetical protein